MVTRMIDHFLVGKDTDELQEKAFQVVRVANYYGDAYPDRVNYDRVEKICGPSFFLYSTRFTKIRRTAQEPSI